jgi:hypothetical protein
VHPKLTVTSIVNPVRADARETDSRAIDPSMPEPDAALIAAAQAGDRRAVDELLARYEERIYRFGLRMCGDAESARQVVRACGTCAEHGCVDCTCQV